MVPSCRFTPGESSSNDCSSFVRTESGDRLIPSIEYLRGPAEAPHTYRIVPGVSIASRGPVASVALFTAKAIRDVRSIALDTSSRTSVALVRVLCAREFKIRPMLYSSGPRLDDMLAMADAGLQLATSNLERMRKVAEGGGMAAASLDQAEVGQKQAAAQAAQAGAGTIG